MEKDALQQFKVKYEIQAGNGLPTKYRSSSYLAARYAKLIYFLSLILTSLKNFDAVYELHSAVVDSFSFTLENCN